MSIKIEIFLSVVVFIILQGQVDQTSAACPTLTPMTSFNASLFAGRWYEVKRYKTVVDAFAGSCASINFTVNSSNNVTIALNTFIKNR